MTYCEGAAAVLLVLPAGNGAVVCDGSRLLGHEDAVPYSTQHTVGAPGR